MAAVEAVEDDDDDIAFHHDFVRLLGVHHIQMNQNGGFYINGQALPLPDRAAVVFVFLSQPDWSQV